MTTAQEHVRARRFLTCCARGAPRRRSNHALIVPLAMLGESLPWLPLDARGGGALREFRGHLARQTPLNSRFAPCHEPPETPSLRCFDAFIRCEGIGFAQLPGLHLLRFATDVPRCSRHDGRTSHPLQARYSAMPAPGSGVNLTRGHSTRNSSQSGTPT